MFPTNSRTFSPPSFNPERLFTPPGVEDDPMHIDPGYLADDECSLLSHNSSTDSLVLEEPLKVNLDKMPPLTEAEVQLEKYRERWVEQITSGNQIQRRVELRIGDFGSMLMRIPLFKAFYDSLRSELIESKKRERGEGVTIESLRGSERSELSEDWPGIYIGGEGRDLKAQDEEDALVEQVVKSIDLDNALGEVKMELLTLYRAEPFSIGDPPEDPSARTILFNEDFWPSHLFEEGEVGQALTQTKDLEIGFPTSIFATSIIQKFHQLDSLCVDGRIYVPSRLGYKIGLDDDLISSYCQNEEGVFVGVLLSRCRTSIRIKADREGFSAWFGWRDSPNDFRKLEMRDVFFVVQRSDATHFRHPTRESTLTNFRGLKTLSLESVTVSDQDGSKSSVPLDLSVLLRNPTKLIHLSLVNTDNFSFEGVTRLIRDSAETLKEIVVKGWGKESWIKEGEKDDDLLSPGATKRNLSGWQETPPTFEVRSIWKWNYGSNKLLKPWDSMKPWSTFMGGRSRGEQSGATETHSLLVALSACNSLRSLSLASSLGLPIPLEVIQVLHKSKSPLDEEIDISCGVGSAQINWGQKEWNEWGELVELVGQKPVTKGRIKVEAVWDSMKNSSTSYFA